MRGGGAPVLQVAVALLGHLPRDPDAGASVGHAGGELVHGGRLVEAGQPPLVVLALLGVVVHDVAVVAPLQLLDGCFDVNHAFLLPKYGNMLMDEKWT